MYHIDLRDGKINEQMNNYNNVCFVTCALSKLFYISINRFSVVCMSDITRLH